MLKRNKIITTFGVIIALMPLLGFPRFWESFLQVLIGLSIVSLSVWASIDKQLTLRAKAQERRRLHRRRTDELNIQRGISEPHSEQVIKEESL